MGKKSGGFGGKFDERKHPRSHGKFTSGPSQPGAKKPAASPKSGGGGGSSAQQKAQRYHTRAHFHAKKAEEHATKAKSAKTESERSMHSAAAAHSAKKAHQAAGHVEKHMGKEHEFAKSAREHADAAHKSAHGGGESGTGHQQNAQGKNLFPSTMKSDLHSAAKSASADAKDMTQRANGMKPGDTHNGLSRGQIHAEAAGLHRKAEQAHKAAGNDEMAAMHAEKADRHGKRAAQLMTPSGAVGSPGMKNSEPMPMSKHEKPVVSKHDDTSGTLTHRKGVDDYEHSGDTEQEARHVKRLGAINVKEHTTYEDGEEQGHVSYQLPKGVSNRQFGKVYDLQMETQSMHSGGNAEAQKHHADVVKHFNEAVGHIQAGRGEEAAKSVAKGEASAKLRDEAKKQKTTPSFQGFKQTFTPKMAESSSKLLAHTQAKIDEIKEHVPKIKKSGRKKIAGGGP